MKNDKSIIVIFLLTAVFSQYQMEWQIGQFGLEYGHPYFDINHDGTYEITKQYLNTVTLFDGNDGWNISWWASDTSHEYYTMADILQLSEMEVGIFLAENYTEPMSFSVHGIEIGALSTTWESIEFPGYISGMDIYDTDSDGIPEIILGVSEYETGADTYTSKIIILSAASGAIEWTSEALNGYLYGVYSGAPDNNGFPDIILNQYDLENEYYALSLITSDGNGCLQGDFNEDNFTDVLDVVGLVSCVIETCDPPLTPCIDLNADGQLDILDIVSLVNFIVAISPDYLINYTNAWTVNQDSWEFGHLLFDMNQDEINDLTKQWGNSISVFDGTQDWELIWYLIDETKDVLTLFDIVNLNENDPAKAIVTGYVENPTVSDIKVYSPGESVPDWESQQIPGSLPSIQSADMDGDGILEILSGININNNDVDSCALIVLDGATGELIWQSEMFPGFMLGPYVGNVDTDPLPEVLINVYDTGTQNYFLAVYSYIDQGEQLLIMDHQFSLRDMVKTLRPTQNYLRFNDPDRKRNSTFFRGQKQ